MLKRKSDLYHINRIDIGNARNIIIMLLQKESRKHAVLSLYFPRILRLLPAEIL